MEDISNFIPVNKQKSTLYKSYPNPINLDSINIIDDLDIKYLDYEFANGKIEFQFTFKDYKSPNDWIGIYLRFTSKTPFSSSYLIYIRQKGDIEIAKYPGPDIIDGLCSMFPEGIEKNDVMSLQIHIINNVLKVNCIKNKNKDNQYIASFSSDKLIYEPKGKIAIACWRTIAEFSNLQILGKNIDPKYSISDLRNKGESRKGKKVTDILKGIFKWNNPWFKYVIVPLLVLIFGGLILYFITNNITETKISKNREQKEKIDTEKEGKQKREYKLFINGKKYNEKYIYVGGFPGGKANIKMDIESDVAVKDEDIFIDIEFPKDVNVSYDDSQNNKIEYSFNENGDKRFQLIYKNYTIWPDVRRFIGTASIEDIAIGGCEGIITIFTEDMKKQRMSFKVRFKR